MSPTDDLAKFTLDPWGLFELSLSLGDSLGDLKGEWILLLREASIDPWSIDLPS